MPVAANGGAGSFRLAAMSPVILWLTLGLWVLPVVFLASAAFWSSPLWLPGLILLAIYGWVWLGFRPTRFVVHRDMLEVIWPLKRREIRRDRIAAVRLVNPRELRNEAGWCLRMGAGGLWGGFGWLWTQRRGLIHMYVSRTDGLIWIECAGGRPWLLTPEQPEAFLRALSG